MRTKVALVCVVTLIVVVMLSGCSPATTTTNPGTGTPDSSSVSSTPAAPTVPDLELVGSTSVMTEDDGMIRYITGEVKNTTNSTTYSMVSIEFNCYDASGDQVGSADDAINNLEPSGTWRFKAMITEDSTRTYKLKSLTGF